MEYAQIFVDNVFRLHSLPEVIISDRDPRFTGKFWRALLDLLGTDLHFSTAFHPQTDGQSERMIQTLENFLRLHVERHPQTWSQYLGLAEFVANNAVNVATGYSPFYLNSSDHPLVPSVLMHGFLFLQITGFFWLGKIAFRLKRQIGHVVNGFLTNGH